MKMSRHAEVLCRWGAAWAAAVTLLHASALVFAADPSPSAPAGTVPAATLESVPGKTIKRIVLSAKAAERLDIQTRKVGEEAIVSRQMVSGLAIVPPGSTPAPQLHGGPPGGFGKQAAGAIWLRIALSPAEWGRLARDKPARVLPLAGRDRTFTELVALPSGRLPIEDPRSSMQTLYYAVQGKESGLAAGDRVRVELELAGSADRQKVVPYGAVYYDAKGAAWVYVNVGQLAFERQRIVVDRVVGDLAVLSDGPPTGTVVVTVGAPLLYGAEIFGK